MNKFYVCDYCHRILEPSETRVIKAGEIGPIRVPFQHVDHDGQRCDGFNAEVIEPWNPA